MGTNKLLLPFGETTVIEHVISALASGGIDDVVIVTGHERERVEAALDRYNVRFAHNANYARGEMFSSIQTGLRVMRPDCAAALISPGDQPLIKARIVAQVIGAYAPGQIVIPSYCRRGGHPILVDRLHWQDILDAPAGTTLRDVMRARSSLVRYIDVDTDSIIQDMDTPEQYQEMLKH